MRRVDEADSLVGSFLTNSELRFSDSFNRSRDSTLRAIALTSSRNLSRWQPFLLELVSLSVQSIRSFTLIKRSRGEFVKSLRFYHDTSNDEEEIAEKKGFEDIVAFSPAVEEGILEDPSLLLIHLSLGVDVINKGILQHCRRIEELIVEHPFFLFHFTFRHQERSLPFPFLNCLKKTFIGQAVSGHIFFSARNFIWLSVFVPTLQEIAIYINASQVDVKFLKDYKETFRHRSNVKKLSISFRFIASQSGTKNLQWKSNGESQISGISGKAQSLCISDLLSVTKELECLEINGVDSKDRDSDGQEHTPEIILSSISNSRPSLKHFRHLLRPAQSFQASQLGLFSNLKHWSTEGNGLLDLTKVQVVLRIERIQLTWYRLHLPEQGRYAEDPLLATLIEGDSLPKLRTVIVPKYPIGLSNKMDTSLSGRNVWIENRKVLREKDYFKSKRIELIESESGTYGEFFWD